MSESYPHGEPLKLTPSLLLKAYANGVFPMSDGAHSTEIYWVDPKFRGIIPLDGLHISRSMRRFVRNGSFEVSINSDFAATVAACAERAETWINEEIKQLYQSLHQLGFAHSVEVWNNGELVGGVYGVSIGGAFFGESMFSRETNMSKVALIWLVARLKSGGFTLFDTQFITDHLMSLGGIEIPRARYHEELSNALAVQSDFFKLKPKTGRDQILHLSTQTS